MRTSVMKILSIIIPAYNSQAFLDKCIGSLLVPEILDRLKSSLSTTVPRTIPRQWRKNTALHTRIPSA